MFRISFVLTIALAPLAAQAQVVQPGQFSAMLRAATPAQQEQIGACIAKNMPVRVQSSCPAGSVAQVSACLRPEAARRAQIKRTCAQTVLSAPAPR